MEPIIKLRVWEKGCTSLNDVSYRELPLDPLCTKSIWNFYPGDLVDLYTGVKDVYGKEIYTNDILQAKYHGEGTVRLDNGCFLVTNEFSVDELNWEIVGNRRLNNDI